MPSRARVETIDITDPAIAAVVVRLQRAAYRAEAELIGSDRIPPLSESATRAIVQTGAANKPAAALYLREGFARVATLEPIPGLRVTKFVKTLA